MFAGLSSLRAQEKKPVELSEEAKARQEYLKRYSAGGACCEIALPFSESWPAYSGHLKAFWACRWWQHWRCAKEEKEKEASKGGAWRHPHH